MKIATLSLAVLSGTSVASLAIEKEYDWVGVLGASGRFQTETMQEDRQSPAISLATMAGSYAWSGAELLGKASYYAASHVANNMGRYAVAYGASYVGVELLMEGTALGMYYGAYAVGALTVAGPGAGLAAGLAAYTITSTALRTMHMIPGMQGALAATYTPFVRPLTDMAIDQGPAAVASAVSTGYSVLKSTASFAQTGFSSFYNWYNS